MSKIKVFFYFMCTQLEAKSKEKKKNEERVRAPASVQCGGGVTDRTARGRTYC